MPKPRPPAALAEMSLFSFAPQAPPISPPQAPPISPVGAEGHRTRMRQRLLKAGPESLADHEMLEMILFTALPRRDTKPIARDLLARFRSFSAVIGAPATELMAVDGVAEAGAAALKLIQAAALRMLRHQVADKPILAIWDRLIDYITAAMTHERVEHFRVLFLDSRNRLIADEVQGVGTINQAPAYPREVIRRCLELHATGVVLVHNHPSGDPAPSREDVALTREIARAGAAMGIEVHDHIIVGKGRTLSFKIEKLL